MSHLLYVTLDGRFLCNQQRSFQLRQKDTSVTLSLHRHDKHARERPGAPSALRAPRTPAAHCSRQTPVAKRVTTSSSRPIHVSDTVGGMHMCGGFPEHSLANLVLRHGVVQSFLRPRRRVRDREGAGSGGGKAVTWNRSGTSKAEAGQSRIQDTYAHACIVGSSVVRNFLHSDKLVVETGRLPPTLAPCHTRTEIERHTTSHQRTSTTDIVSICAVGSCRNPNRARVSWRTGVSGGGVTGGSSGNCEVERISTGHHISRGVWHHISRGVAKVAFDVQHRPRLFHDRAARAPRGEVTQQRRQLSPV